MTNNKSTILFWVEAAVTAVLIALSCFFYIKKWVRPDVVLVIDVLAGLNALNATMMKLFIDVRADVLAERHHYVDGCTGEIGAILAKVESDDLKYARTLVDTLLTRLRRVKEGVHELNPTEYYCDLIATMNRAPPNSNVFAVSSLPIERWMDDPNEVHYMQANFDAVTRKVNVYRLFILDRPGFLKPISPAVSTIIAKHRDKGVHVEVIWRETVALKELLDDFVVFEHEQILFLDWHDPNDVLRISRGERVKNKARVDDYKGRFDTLKMALTAELASVDRELNIL